MGERNMKLHVWREFLVIFNGPLVLILKRGNVGRRQSVLITDRALEIDFSLGLLVDVVGQRNSIGVASGIAGDIGLRHLTGRHGAVVLDIIRMVVLKLYRIQG